MKVLKLFLAVFLINCNPILSQNIIELLGRPTDNSITLSILFNKKVEFYIEYSENAGFYNDKTLTFNNTPNKPVKIELQNLLSGTRYYYRTRYRENGTGNFLPGEEHTFHTQRKPGSTFTFTIEADEHLYDKKGNRNIYKICIDNQVKDSPDFMFTMGDIFGDDHTPTTTTSEDMDELHKDYLQYLGKICHSSPLFICLGNHEGEKAYYLHQNPPENIAVYGTLWRKYYYANPYPNHFYSGNTDVEDFGIGNPENYYAFTWGDALFVVLDVYRYASVTSPKPGNWNWTLGQKQYDWLKQTLENNNSKFKFVFAHHVSGEGRGGINQAKKFEWGGYDVDGTTYNFTKNRPDMAKPIHQLFIDNKVNIFFQGHDHLFARETMDGVIYQEVPMPSDSTYSLGMIANADAYVSDIIGGTGHLRVSVCPTGVKVDFVRAWLPKDTLSGVNKNGEVAFSYTIGNYTSDIITIQNNEDLISIYPNPTSQEVNIHNPGNSLIKEISIIDLSGKTLLTHKVGSNAGLQKIDISNKNTGIYIVRIVTENEVVNRKLIKTTY